MRLPWVWAFALYAEVPFTNNQADRDLVNGGFGTVGQCAAARRAHRGGYQHERQLARCALRQPLIIQDS